MLTVCEYHLYELLKFVLKSVIGVHNDSFLNDLCVIQDAKRATRNSDSSLLFEPFCKRKIERFSIRYRACKLFNKLRVLNLIPAHVKSCSFSEISAIYYSLKIYLVQNHELVKHIFGLYKKKFKTHTRWLHATGLPAIYQLFCVKKMTSQILLVFEISRFFDFFWIFLTNFFF